MGNAAAMHRLPSRVRMPAISQFSFPIAVARETRVLSQSTDDWTHPACVMPRLRTMQVSGHPVAYSSKHPVARAVTAAEAATDSREAAAVRAAMRHDTRAVAMAARVATGVMPAIRPMVPTAVQVGTSC